MALTQHCACVLWGEQCDEAVATLFVTQLRAAGLRVWLVGMGGKQGAGLYGLRLVPDLTLEEALPLTPQVQAVIVPCSSEQWLRFLNDPRLLRFLQSALVNRAQLWLADGTTLPTELAQAVQDARLPDPRVFYTPGANLCMALPALIRSLG